MSLFPLLLLPLTAQALTLSLKSEDTPASGVTVRHYHTTDPTTQTWVVLVDLCTSYVHVDATRAPSDTQTTGSWADDRGVAVATNGDFYKTGPVRVYGDAVGGGIRWPSDQTGLGSDYDGEWYWEHYGWIAFGPDQVWYTHTGWVKENASSFGTLAGWSPTDLQPAPPSGTLALVSGFPELVVEGKVMTCADPEDSSCFPDRSDMRDPNPRTAMGITEDLGTFILAVVDGRTSSSEGMYGSELADLMGQVGAWEAFNVDGGGSSQLWVDGDGYVNDYDGNNSGGGAREVANHWGVFAGSGRGQPERAGHCTTAAPCAELPAEGGILDDQGACFQTFGSPEYWREEDAGYDGHLYWTNAWETSSADNWAWWQVHLAEGGEYLVEQYADATFSVYDKVRYVIRADGADHEFRVDQGAGTGWQSLGTWTFAAGGDQWIAVYDDATSSVDSPHVSADAIRLTRAGSWCGNGTCDDGEDCGSCSRDCPAGVEIPDSHVDDDCDGSVDETAPDTGVPADTSTPPDTSGPGDTSGSPDSDSGSGGGDITDRQPKAGCHCATGGGARWAWWAVLAMGLIGWRRRR